MELYEILTERLRLRRFTEDEADKIYALFSNPEVMRYYPQTYDLEVARRALAAALKGYRERGYWMLAVERRSDGEYLGQIGLLHWDDVDAREDVEVAYLLLPQYWGQGYATEAAIACRDWAFEHLGVDRVVSFIDIANAPSIAVAERNGMRRTKRLEENRFGRPMYVYAIEREPST